jgi:hypothetical protein
VGSMRTPSPRAVRSSWNPFGPQKEQALQINCESPPGAIRPGPTTPLRFDARSVSRSSCKGARARDDSCSRLGFRHQPNVGSFTRGQTSPGGFDLKSGVTHRIVPCDPGVGVLEEFIKENPL